MHEVVKLTPTIVEVVVKAPAAARKFRPGQFYRLQNYEANAAEVDATRLAMEGLALTGAWVDRERGLVSTIVLEMGGSSDLCALLEPGEPVVLDGPDRLADRDPVRRDRGAGGRRPGQRGAVLDRLGVARSRLARAVLRRLQDRSSIATKSPTSKPLPTSWCGAATKRRALHPTRPQDRTYVGNIVRAMQAYAAGELGEPSIPICRRPTASSSSAPIA